MKPKSKKPTADKLIQKYSIDQVIQRAQDFATKADKYVKKTGLCFECKKNRANPGQVVCQKCINKIEEILEQLCGPGFVELPIFPIPIRRIK